MDDIFKYVRPSFKRVCDFLIKNDFDVTHASDSTIIPHLTITVKNRNGCGEANRLYDLLIKHGAKLEPNTIVASFTPHYQITYIELFENQKIIESDGSKSYKIFDSFLAE